MSCEDYDMWAYDICTGLVDQSVIDEFNLDESYMGSNVVWFGDTIEVTDGYNYIDLSEQELSRFENHLGSLPDDFGDRVVFVAF
jgi:hypothetical protein